jgi:hypothetical protein
MQYDINNAAGISVSIKEECAMIGIQMPDIAVIRNEFLFDIRIFFNNK